MRVCLLLLVSLISTQALGATVSGRITSGGTGIAGMEVRLWARTAKGYSFQPPDGQVVVTGATGDYSFGNVAAGTYKLDTRMSMAVSGNYGDRWLDLAPPIGNGYLAESADELVIAASDALTGQNITVDVNGGLEGRTVGSAATAIGGLFARLESTADVRVHHNDQSKTTPAFRLGEVSFRGLPPGGYQLLLHDPNFVYADVAGPTFNLTAMNNGAAGDVTVPLAPADALEPNNTFAGGTVVDPMPLRLAQPLSGAGIIGPRNSGDVDFYCWTALEGERYLVSAVGTFGTYADGGVRESPWVDPVVSFWAGGMKVGEDDDSGPLSFDARLDTGLVPAGPVCVAVSTFGDTMWTGQTQGSAGPYSVRVEMGNRGPTLALTSRGLPTPVPPTAVMMNEGNSITVAATFSDPDGNPLTATWRLVNAQNQVVSSGTFNGASGMGSVFWSASQSAARNSPYTLTVRVADAEFDITRTVLINVQSVNSGPRTPVQVSPDAGSVVRTSRPPLVCRESPDDDADPIRYEFELAWLDGGQMVQTATVAGNDAGIEPDGGVFGLVSFVPQSLPENARLTWRVRAFDGNPVSGYSVWTDWWSFTVDVTNDPPGVPVLVKPANGDELMVRQPTLEVTHPADPEGDAVSFIFEIARDTSFSQLAVQSPQVPATGGSTTTSWTSTSDLEWGQAYFARAIAIDTRGARSQPSNANRFVIRGNTPPMPARFGEPFSNGLCSNQVFSAAPTSLVIGPTNDVEQDIVMVEVQIAKAEDTMFTMPVFRTEVRANATTGTTIGFDGVMFAEDQQYLVRARSRDGQNMTEWISCSFTVDAMRMGGDGGTTMVKVKKPCGCSAGEGVLALGALALLLRRRRSSALR